MGISPIDLQTLYTQMDKVGKAQLSQQAALEQAREMSESDVRKAAEAKAKSVQKAETGENAVGKVDDHKEPSAGDGEEAKKEGAKAEEAEAPNEEASPPLSATPPLDEGLGKHIDISI